MFNIYLKVGKKNSLILLKSWYFKQSKLPLVFSTGLKIQNDLWDKKNRKCKEGRTNPIGKSINGLVDQYKAIGQKFIIETQLLEGRTPGHDEVKKVLNEAKDRINGVSKTIDGVKTDLLKFVYSFYLKKKNDPARSESYCNGFRTLHSNLLDYQKQNKRVGFSFHLINAEWCKDWQIWNFTKNEFAQNTVQGYWKRFKTVLNAAADKGLIKEKFWIRKELTIAPQKADEIFLTQKELAAIYTLELPEDKHHLDTVRDIFLLDAMNSGHRMNDMAGIDQSNVIELNEAKVIKIHAAKTDTLVYSANGWFLREFLLKYKDGFPSMKSEQVFNRQLRELCKLAGIDKPTKLRKSKAGKNIYVTKPKWEWVHQYTARYSFATNLSLAGVAIQDISKLMGHSNIKQTEGYIKSKQLHAAINAAKNPFFSEKPDNWKKTNSL